MAISGSVGKNLEKLGKCHPQHTPVEILKAAHTQTMHFHNSKYLYIAIPEGG